MMSAFILRFQEECLAFRKKLGSCSGKTTKGTHTHDQSSPLSHDRDYASAQYGIIPRNIKMLYLGTETMTRINAEEPDYHQNEKRLHAIPKCS
jgi:hypothetical protein